jgi:ubiquinone/menaquinone biosynthesis C-methylase UbiE
VDPEPSLGLAAGEATGKEAGLTYEFSARFYDAIYSFKDYAAEAGWLRYLLTEQGHPDGRLLDVACGTGAHLLHLHEHYQVEGLDLDRGMLDVARRRLPEVRFDEGDMRTFDLGRRFDVVTCLFSAIGYMLTTDDLDRAVANMARHLEAGGVLAIEPWLSPEQWTSGKVHALLVEEADLKVARMNVSQPPVDGLSVLEFHYLVGEASGVRHVTERHALRLFEDGEYRRAFERAGLAPRLDAEGPSGRGLYYGLRDVG